MSKAVALLTDPIELNTEFGFCKIRHVTVEDESGESLREGVFMESPVPVSSDVPLLLRIQSSCLFSETFRAVDCDCARQLHESMRRVLSRGGAVLYFYEEGRGAGLMKKFKAIRLQQFQKLDTKSAFRNLNIAPDMRSYEAAAAVLKEAVGNGRSIRLLTNNPDREKGLRQQGVNVVEIEGIVCGLDDARIAEYLDEKRRVLGHSIPARI